MTRTLLTLAALGTLATVAAFAGAGCATDRAPSWPAGASVHLVNDGNGVATVAWTPADDDHGVVVYEVAVFQGGERTWLTRAPVAHVAAAPGRTLGVEV